MQQNSPGQSNACSERHVWGMTGISLLVQVFKIVLSDGIQDRYITVFGSLEALYGNLNLYGNLKKVNFC